MFPKGIIATADDDLTYDSFWLEGLYQSYKKNSNAIHFFYGRLIDFKTKEDGTTALRPYTHWKPINKEGQGHHLFPLGGAGALYGPIHSHPDLCNEEIFMNIAPTCDDIWLKAMALLSNIPSCKVNYKYKEWISYRPMYIARLLQADVIPLRQSNLQKKGNDFTLQRIIKTYPQIIDTMRTDIKYNVR